MGMAASQARLLCITARMHDVEYQAQSIQNAKTQLATQSDQVYNDYLEALDASTLTLTKIDPASGSKSMVAATFNNLVSRKRLVPADGSNYLLRDAKGRLIVENDILEAYYRFQDQKYEKTPYMFALYMMGKQPDYDHFSNDVNAMRKAEYDACVKDIEKGNKALNDIREKLYTMVDPDNSDNDYRKLYDINYVSVRKNIARNQPDKLAEYDETLNKYLRLLYKTNSEQIFLNLYEDDGFTQEDFNQDLFNYYVDIYNEIQTCGGCVSITDYNGFNGDAANDSEWLKSMVECGQISIEVFKTDKKTGDFSVEATSPSSDISVSYTTTSQIDETAVAKAEAKYNHDLKEIDRKDKKYDMTLSKLETERKALDTQRESIKKVITENIDRTFGIFS